MTIKEIGEVRRQLNPEKSNITKVYGCYINQAGEPISDYEQSVGMMREEEKEYYHTLLKKVLSGGQGRTLFDLSFPTAEVAGGEYHGRLMTLVKTRCADEQARTALYQQIVSAVKLETNYVILLACNQYDVPHKHADGERDLEGGDQVYTHILCAVCPVKQAKPGLGYHSEDKVFHTSVGDYLIAPPQWGFLFPAFDNRATNLYDALCYLRQEDEQNAAFVSSVFALDCPPSERSNRQGFADMLEELEDQCSMEVVTTLSQRVRELAEEHKAEHREEDFAVSGDELRLMLDECGVSEERLDNFSRRFEERYGKGEMVDPGILLDTKSCQVKLPDVSIKASPEAAERMETRVIDGVPYLLIPTEGEIEVNGVSVSVKTEG